jgi:hypothetical protein
MILQWQHEGSGFTAVGEHHRYEVTFDEVGKAVLVQSSVHGRFSPVLRTTSGFVAAARMKGQAQVWEAEVGRPISSIHRTTGKRRRSKVFSWGPFG